MQVTIYNPQKGRLETIDIEVTENNTTWFSNCSTAHDISMITDFEGGILISGFDYRYPIWISDVSRSGIGNDQKKAKQLRRQYE